MMMAAFNLIVFPLLFMISATYAGNKESRNLSTEFLIPANITCQGQNCTNLVHTTATGAFDDFHYLYSTLGVPSILVVKTKKGENVTVDWDKFVSTNSSTQSGSVSFKDGSVLASALLSFDVLYVFNDIIDGAKMEDNLMTATLNLTHLEWELGKPCKENKDLVRFVSKMKLDVNKTQTITFEFLASSGNEESTSELPHLLLNSNLTQINVYFDSVYYNFSKPRIGLGMSLITLKNHFTQSYLVEEKSLNDELSPGAFRTLNWLSNENVTTSKQDPSMGVFVQWKPISYVSLNRSIQSLTGVSTYRLDHLSNTSYIPVSLATGFYGYLGLGNMWISRTNVSFGATKDNFYSKTNFLTWQLTFGIGEHPQGTISMLVILLIVIGLGIPILVMIAGAIYLPIRSKLMRRRGYEELTSSYPRIA